MFINVEVCSGSRSAVENISGIFEDPQIYVFEDLCSSLSAIPQDLLGPYRNPRGFQSVATGVTKIRAMEGIIKDLATIP